MKFDQLTEYDKRNIFIQKFYRKWVKENSSKLLFDFWKGFILDKSKWY